ncbi:adenosylmethionine decarboxylase [Thermoleophilum album]|uniref:S-adenosylmethionine decarboxylase proenzyme n=1 Tax=Thermoleophilum album TaxID=29539 RepID=A0A1H6FL49_THEAL|nr:adenosylmethionine decarboxylase [Thermoleophilum album]SEH10573.1 spermidine synthase [Thermoleophilum album]
MALGRQVLCEFWGAQGLDDEELARTALRRAVEAGGATLVRLEVHRFSPWGVSGVAVIAESHLALHTWPEHGYAAVDVFTCGDTDLDAMIDVMLEAYRPAWTQRRTIERGVHPETETVTGEDGAAERADLDDRVWVFEEREPASPIRAVYPVRRLLEAVRTDYQTAAVFESPGLGRVLAIDDIVQLTERDAFVYHELLAHPPLHAHPEPRTVAIVGGGDGHTLAEVLKHEVIEKVAVLELDRGIVELAKRHFEVAQEAFGNPRVELIIGDAFDTLADLDFRPDVILCDVPDPIGSAERLFGEDFYARCKDALADGGMLSAQTESAWWHAETLRACYEAIGRHFKEVSVTWGVVPSYPGAWWTFTIGSRRWEPWIVRREPELETRLYEPRYHSWFMMPRGLCERLPGLMGTSPLAARR